MELAVRDLYRLDQLPEPTFIVDGGGNTGMFTLEATARWPDAKLKICEPVPHNLETLAENLRMNSVEGELIPVALGGTAGLAKFYCRGATQGSFSSDLPYHSVIEVKVSTLSEVCQGYENERILIKLDIEGAEVAVLHEFLQRRREQTTIIGELHLRQKSKPKVMDLLQRNGWQTHFFEESENYSQFHFFSPDLVQRSPIYA
jgi:FkbM family methyltransferase